MPGMDTTSPLQLNYWAVLVAGVATFLLGALWYSPLLFEGAWKRANGYSDETVQQIVAGPTVFVVTFACYVVMASFVALASRYVGATGVAAGLGVGIAIWLGAVAATGLATNMFSDKPVAAWLIDGGFQLVSLSMIGGIVARWR